MSSSGFWDAAVPIGGSSYLAELVRGIMLEDATKIRNTGIAKKLRSPSPTHK